MLQTLTCLILRSLSRRLLLISWACRRLKGRIGGHSPRTTAKNSSLLSNLSLTRPRTRGPRRTSEPMLSRHESPIWQQSPPHFLELTMAELELAFETLVEPEPTPPKELQHLTPEDWMCLESLLDLILEQLEHSPLH